jgi:hypothetical protein
MKALPIVEKGGMLLRLVLSVVAFGLVCCCVVRWVVAFGLVKEVMGWRYFADVASMSFSEKNNIAACDLVFWGYGVKSKIASCDMILFFARKGNEMSEKTHTAIHFAI